MSTGSAGSGNSNDPANIIAAAACGGRLHHCYIVASSERGVVAEAIDEIALMLLCEAPQGAGCCGQCKSSSRVSAEAHPDLLVLRPNERGRIGIDDVRDLQAQAALQPVFGSRKVIALPVAEALSMAAQNALLKTLEEPLGATIFLLGAQRPRSLLPTVRSRALMVRAPPRPLSVASAALAAGGVADELIDPLSRLVGADLEQALTLQDNDAAQINGLLERLSNAKSASLVLDIAKEIAKSPERSKAALSLLELRTCTALRTAPGSRAGRRASATAARLQEYRRALPFNPNHRLALEVAMLQYCGFLSPN